MKAMLKTGVMAVALAAVACGGISSKEDAAAAAQRVANAGSAAQAGMGSPLLAEGFGNDAAITVSGKTGTAKITVKTDAGEGNFSAVLEIAYTNFSADGENTLDGTITQSFKTEFDVSNPTAGMSTINKMKGKVTMSGEFDSVLDMDVTQSMSVSASQTGGSVSVTMDGTIVADGTTYTYAKESISIDFRR